MVFGVGINDADYTVQPKVDGKQVWCPFYMKWHSMLRRCYCLKTLAKKPTYQGCVVCSEWIYFSNFKEWMELQDWEEKELDKDLIGDGSVYSPTACCFVEPWLNALFNNCVAACGLYPIGVSKHLNKFKALLSVSGHRKHIGVFDTPEEASVAYQKARRQYVTAKMRNYPDQRIKQAVLGKLK